MDEERTYKIPLALCKQASMKLDSFMTDIREILEDEDVEPEDKATFSTMLELGSAIMVNLVNLVRKECEETDFLSEQIPMDEIDPWPGDGVDDDVLDTEAE